MTHAHDIEEQAAQWLVRRDAGAYDVSAFTAWLAADPRHRAAYLRISEAWERTGNLKRLAPDGSAIDADLLSAQPPRRLRLWRPLAVAAVLATVTLSAAWWFLTQRGVETYRTEVGGLSRIVLADGSTVTLNTDSQLRVRLTLKRREITLVRGEAHFIVAHDATRPFEVSAGGRLVRAVGTAFDVRLDPGAALEVMVTEGRVAVEEGGNAAVQHTLPSAPTRDSSALSTNSSRAPARNSSAPSGSTPFSASLARDTGSGFPGSAAAVVPAASGFTDPSGSGAIFISAGETATAQRGSVTVHTVTPAETSRRLAWQSGELSFQGETLEQAVREFNRYNRKKLRIDDPAVAQLEVGGNFQAIDVESFVAALTRSFNVVAKQRDDGTVVLEGATKRREP